MNDPLSFSKKDDCLLLAFSGDLDLEALPQLKENIETWKKFLLTESEEGAKKMNVLVDASGMSGSYHVSALNEIVSMVKWDHDYIHKTAVFGVPEIVRVSAAMIKLLGGRDNMNFFKSKEEALSWLQGE